MLCILYFLHGSIAFSSPRFVLLCMPYTAPPVEHPVLSHGSTSVSGCCKSPNAGLVSLGAGLTPVQSILWQWVSACSLLISVMHLVVSIRSCVIELSYTVLFQSRYF